VRLAHEARFHSKQFVAYIVYKHLKTRELTAFNEPGSDVERVRAACEKSDKDSKGGAAPFLRRFSHWHSSNIAIRSPNWSFAVLPRLQQILMPTFPCSRKVPGVA
jgi:hypothetical protein